VTYCNDIRQLERYGTEDPSQPGVYVPTSDELDEVIAAARERQGDDAFSGIPENLRQLAAAFAEDALRLSEENPIGSSWIEQVNCQDYAHVLPD